MSSDLQKLMRAMKVIAKVAWKYEAKDIAEAAMKHCAPRRQRRESTFDHLRERFPLH